jgi:hypothetical protein
MAITVKGIQYSYQIDFFDQVPTRLKSQVHDLPVLSVPEPTAIDDYSRLAANLPDTENRLTTAGVNAAPEAVKAEIVGESPGVGFSEASALNNQQPIFGQFATGQNQEALKADANQASAKPAIVENRFTPVASEPQQNIKFYPAVESEDIPTVDSKPDESVKATPRFLFNLAQKAYKPDYGTYLQTTGFEEKFQAGAVNAEPAAPSISRPQVSSPHPIDRTEMANTIVEPEPVGNNFENTDIKQSIDSNYSDTDSTLTEPVERSGSSFIAMQAQKLYELYDSTSLFLSNRQIDFYF